MVHKGVNAAVEEGAVRGTVTTSPAKPEFSLLFHVSPHKDFHIDSQVSFAICILQQFRQPFGLISCQASFAIAGTFGIYLSLSIVYERRLKTSLHPKGPISYILNA